MTRCPACGGQLYLSDELIPPYPSVERVLTCLLCGRSPAMWPVEQKARAYEAQWDWCSAGHLLSPDNILNQPGTTKACRECSSNWHAEAHRKHYVRVEDKDPFGSCLRGHRYTVDNVTENGDCLTCADLPKLPRAPKPSTLKVQGPKPVAPSCRNGHPNIPENRIIHPQRPTKSDCRLCKRERDQRFKQRRAAA